MITAPFHFFGIWLLVCATIIVCGHVSNNKGMTTNGVTLLAIVLLILIAWTLGAKWQREDTLKKYNLTAKEVPA